jgi:hypothetical protein
MSDSDIPTIDPKTLADFLAAHRAASLVTPPVPDPRPADYSGLLWSLDPYAGTSDYVGPDEKAERRAIRHLRQLAERSAFYFAIWQERADAVAFPIMSEIRRFPRQAGWCRADGSDDVLQDAADLLGLQHVDDVTRCQVWHYVWPTSPDGSSLYIGVEGGVASAMFRGELQQVPADDLHDLMDSLRNLVQVSDFGPDGTLNPLYTR